jgi:glycosyl transferase, family 25
MDIPYFVVHYSKNKDRKERLEKEFLKYEISFVKWMSMNDRENMSENEHLYVESKNSINKGQISLTLKHYFALKDIVENEISIAIIMEDNVTFKEDIKKKVNQYLKEAEIRKIEWDIIFEGDTHYLKYKEGKVRKDKLLYKKSNKVTKQCLGSSRCSNFYIINIEAAKVLYKNFVPFNNVCDHWSNYLFRNLNFNIWWVEPPIVHRIMTHKRVAETGK